MKGGRDWNGLEGVGRGWEKIVRKECMEGVGRKGGEERKKKGFRALSKKKGCILVCRL